MADVTLWRDICVLAKRAEREFGLPSCFIVPFLGNGRMDGDCFCAPGSGNRRFIRLRVHRVRMHRKGVWKPRNAPVSRSTILSSLAHELAHLKVLEHGPEHRALTRSIAEWIEEQGHAVAPKLYAPSFGRKRYRYAAKRRK